MTLVAESDVTLGPMSTTHSAARASSLADFTTDLRVIPLSIICIGIGVVGAFLALILLKLIYLFTNLFFFHRWSFEFNSPAQNTLGIFVILVPIVGGLIVGIMARFGSERIRGHGIPEAIEAIPLRGAKVEPRVAVFKPVSAAIAIGSGGPFGAEGPIIMTGGAVGSLIAQLFHMSSAERKTLLVAGAAAGMSATFAAPISAVLLAVELLLFEWEPRSLTTAVQRMASSGFTKLPVVKREHPNEVVCIISISDLLKARSAAQETEERRERVLQLSVPLLFRGQEDEDSKGSAS